MTAVARPSPTQRKSAAAVALRYVSDTMPGILRVRRGAGFGYRRSDGSWLRNADELARIRRLAIPPAYESVWICALPNGHLQATGVDSRGRKQYRYHVQFRAGREQRKFEALEAFGNALPGIRAAVARDLAAASGPGVARTLVLATLVRLLDKTFMRIGNDQYARDNNSFGLTTLRNAHAVVGGSVLKLRFRGKGSKLHQVALDDRRVAGVVRRCQALPGQQLFEYRAANGRVAAIGSADVNEYLSNAAGGPFTAKHFRTWHGTVQALELMRQASVSNAAFRLNDAVAEVARLLGNTPAVCRKAYIHPALLELGQSLQARPGSETHAAALATLQRCQRVKARRGLQAAELRALAFLRILRRTTAVR